MNYIPWLAGAAQCMPPPQEGGGGSFLNIIFMFAMIAFLYYFLLHQPQKRRQRERQKMLDELKKGDEVITAGGIYGRIAGVTDTVVTLEIAPKVRIKVQKTQISTVTGKSDEEKIKEPESGANKKTGD